MEPKITINGVNLTHGQDMAVRVAIVSFKADLQNEGLGEDEHGKLITAAYIARLNEVIKLF